MKFEIKSVIPGEFQAVNVLHVYPYGKQPNLYRRHTPGDWEHFFRNRWWQLCSEIVESLEDTYQKWAKGKKRNK